MKDPCDDGKGLCLDYINGNILVVIMYYSFERWYYRRKWGIGYMGSLSIISYNCVFINNYLNKKFN